jgi:NAD(P)-dependent dehydrogenase (short-subunit alcohol dehydrogenase family)
MAGRGTVLVTGAAQGMGLAIARRAVAAGYHAAMVDRQAAVLETAARQLGDDATPFVLDLLDLNALASLSERVEGACGPLVGLVNNAGIVKTQDFTQVTPTDWETIFGVNARAPFLLMQTVGARMVERGAGAIVNIASVAGRSARAQQTVYGASKAALLHLTKSAAAAYGPHGVRVNAVCPGVILTEMTERIWADRRPEDVQQILRSIPLKRPGEPDEVAATVLWLLGPDASYVNGQAVNVCGGLEMD